MKSFKEFGQLNEARITMAKLRPGLKLSVFHKGRSAKNYGVDGEDVYGGKVQVLGVGLIPFGKKAEKRHVVAKDYKDAQKKYNDIWKSEEVMYGQYWNSLNKMKFFFEKISEEDRKFKPGWVGWIWKIIDGPNKGQMSYCFIDSDDKWAVTFLNKSTEFTLES